MRLYKALTPVEWSEMATYGCFCGSPADRRHGFVFLLTAEQLPGTIAGQRRLMLLERASGKLSDGSRCWETSRDNTLIPHLYGPLDIQAIRRRGTLASDKSGRYALPSEFADD